MCIDDGCDELLCCLCAPLAAIFLCQICKNKMGSNNVDPAPGTVFYQQPDSRVPVAGIYGPQGYGPCSQNQMQFYPGGPQQQAFQGNYFPSNQGYARNDLPPVHVRQQLRPF